MITNPLKFLRLRPFHAALLWLGLTLIGFHSLSAQIQIQAEFDDGDSSDFADGFPGMAGSGWAGPWQVQVSGGSNDISLLTAGVIDDDPLTAASGNYLQIINPAGEGEEDGNRIVVLSRAMQNFDGVDLEEPHTVRFSFRLEDSSAFDAATATAFRFLSTAGSTSANSTDHRWWLGAFEALGSRNWFVRDGNRAGGGPTAVDTGIPLVQGVTYTFEFLIDPANGRTFFNMTTSDGQSFDAGELGFRSSATTGGSHFVLNEQKDLAAVDAGGRFLGSAYSFDGFAVIPDTPPPTDSEDPGGAAPDGWAAETREIVVPSSADGTDQPAVWFAAEGEDPRPLLVSLHSWNGTYLQTSNNAFATRSINANWNFINPNFRGRNNNPDATGSDLVVSDIIDAVNYARANANVDESRIYLVGASGGGHAALLMAGRTPHIWAAVSAWVPITNLVAWYNESIARGNTSYSNRVAASVGGVPTPGTAAYDEALHRSPLTYLANAGSVPLDINSGINDGHDSASVPVNHSLYAFNAVADPADRLTQAQIDTMTESRTIPAELEDEAEVDPTYGTLEVLFRRQSNRVRITLSNGGHQIVAGAAFDWLAEQQKTLYPTDQL